MTKAELIDQVHTQGETQSRAHAERVVNAVFESIADGINRTGDVRVMGFGTFLKIHRPARTVRNPQTGNMIDVPAKEVVKFKPAMGLKNRIN